MARHDEIGGFAFGPERRLKRRTDFLRVQSVGQRAMAAHFVLLVAPREPAGACARLGIVVTKKVGNSPERNRIKRLCRECFRTWPGLVPDGIDLVVIARDGAAELGLAEVRAEWERARPALLKRCTAVLAGAGKPQEKAR